MNKLNSPRKTYIIVGIIMVILILGLGSYIKRDGIQRRWYGYQVRHQLGAQIEPLRQSLETLGFTNLPAPNVSCSKTPQASTGTLQNSCVASIKKYIVVGSSTAVTTRLTSGAEQLSAQLNAHGWKQRKDLPTITWFKAIGQNVDYQPDQLNSKQLDDMTCTLDFYTAYSKPAPPAVNMVITCEKPKISNTILGPNF